MRVKNFGSKVAICVHKWEDYIRKYAQSLYLVLRS